MIFREHRVRRVRRVIVPKHYELLLFTALDNLGRSSGKLRLDLVDNGNNERGNQRKDKEIDLV